MREVPSRTAGPPRTATPRRHRPPSARRRRLLAEGLVLLALVLAALACAAPPGEAHAVLVATQPEDGSILDRAPGTLLLRFDDPVEAALGGVQVADAAGRRVDRGRPGHPAGDRRVLQVPLRRDLNGAYTATWRVSSDDGHQVDGSIGFIVRGGGDGWLAAGGAGGGGSGRQAGALLACARLLLFAALLVLVGGLAFVLVIWPEGAGTPRVRRLLAGSWTAAALATLAAVPLQGLVATGAPLGDALDGGLLAEVLGTRYGRVSLLRLGLLGAAIPVLLVVSRRPEVVGRPGAGRRLVPPAAVLGAGLLATPGLAGHAASGKLVPLGVAADLLHLAAVSAWLGGLVVLVTSVLPRRQPAELRRVLPRFSELAFDAVVVIVVSGLYQAWRQVGQPGALASTPYGRLLLAKVAAAAVLVAFGAVSRRLVQDRLVASGPLVARPAGPGAARLDPDVATVARLRRSVTAEVAVAAVVLTLTAALVDLEPAARAAAAPAATAGPFSTSLATTTGTVTVEVAPARVGLDQVALAVLDRRGRPAAVDRLALELRDPARGGAPLKVTLAEAGRGRYGGAVRVPSPGWWQLALTIRHGDLRETQVTTLSIR
ncbi:MAG TPA: FixH family protein [Actinomycetota bacterium]